MATMKSVKVLSLTVILFIGFVMISSSGLERLENEIITKSGFKIVSLGQYEFGRGGVVLVALDEGENGILKSAVALPVLNRVVVLQDIEFKFEEIPLEFIAESWSGTQVVSYRKGELNEISESRGFGFSGRALRWFFESGFVACLIVYGPMLVQRFRNKRKGSS